MLVFEYMETLEFTDEERKEFYGNRYELNLRKREENAQMLRDYVTIQYPEDIS